MDFSQRLKDFVSLPSNPKFESPCYVYSEKIFLELLENFENCLKKHKFKIPLRWHYAMKANALPEMMKLFRSHGAGIDLVSAGELEEAMACGFTNNDMVFSGVGKNAKEIRLALQNQVFMMNVESESELNRISHLAEEMKVSARYSLRVNPDVDAKTHPYISTGMWEHKFGLPFDQAYELYTRHQSTKHLNAVGLSLHIGSQIFDMAVLGEAVDKTIELARRLRNAGVNLEVFDVGGGLGVDYSNADQMPQFEAYAKFLFESSEKWRDVTEGKGRMVFECGRAFTAQAGFVLTEVLNVKKSLKKNFLIVDASMTELLRPALYKAEHPVWHLLSSALSAEKNLMWEVVGPVCESSDVLARNIALESVSEGDLLLLGCAGAYGAVMSQTYNSRPLPEEWWITSKGEWKLLRKSQQRKYL